MKSVYWLLLVLCCSVLIRLVFPLGSVLFDSNYHFIGSVVPYFYQPDSYARGVDSVGGLFFESIFFHVVGLSFFFFTLQSLRVSRVRAALGTFFLSVFPVFYVQSYFGMVDSPHFIFCLLSIICYVTVGLLKKERYSFEFWCWLLYLGLCFGFLYSGWSGAVLVVLVWLCSVLFYVWEGVKNFSFYVVSGVFIGGFMGYLLYMLLPVLVEYHGIREYILELWPMKLPLFFVVLGFCVVVVWKCRGDFFIRYYLGVSFVLYCGLAVYMRRFGFFAAVFMVLVLVYGLRRVDLRVFVWVFSGLILVSLVNVGVLFWDSYPVMERPFQEVLESLDDAEIICDWSVGHLVNAFTVGDARYRAHPDKVSIDVFGRALGNLTLLDDLAATDDYYVVLFVADPVDLIVDGFSIVSLTNGERHGLIVLRRVKG